MPVRVRKQVMILFRLSWLVFVVFVLLDVFRVLSLSWWLTMLPAAVAVAVTLGVSRMGRAHHADRPAAIEVAPPVRGRWSALNSPADKVPSHGTHAYGQTYAIDVVAEGTSAAEGTGVVAEGKPGARPAFAWLWPVVRRNRDFPAFGEPLLAVADGTVVYATDRQRDHLSRNSLPALVYLMLIESAVREIGGAGLVTGNRLVLDLGDSTYALYAHLQRGSLQVRAGDRVRTGQVLARCGNSGNSSEPHVHFQLMDHPDPDVARGVPFRWEGIGVPANTEEFTVDGELMVGEGLAVGEELILGKEERTTAPSWPTGEARGN
ncbi:peptidoglycan DD-metalloendopeptidase family protein [Streptomyces sp. SID4917]|nr:peptidoglycan DD-metalloendopeptidase family protein [Streptomyces sp. SID4917]